MILQLLIQKQKFEWIKNTYVKILLINIYLPIPLLEFSFYFTFHWLISFWGFGVWGCQGVRVEGLRRETEWGWHAQHACRIRLFGSVGVLLSLIIAEALTSAFPFFLLIASQLVISTSSYRQSLRNEKVYLPSSLMLDSR